MTEDVTPTPSGDNPPAPNATPPVDVTHYEQTIAKLEAEKQKALGEAMERKRKLENFKDVDVDEYRRLKTDFGSVSGDELADIRETMAAAKTDEERKLLKERGLQGYVEYHSDKRLASTQSAHEKAQAETTAELEKARERADLYQTRLRETTLETATLSALDDKFADTAKPDILMNIRASVTYDENEVPTFMYNGEPLFAEGNKPADVKDWLSRMVEDRPHWLKPSIAARAPGSGGGATPTENPYQKTGRDASLAQMKLEHENPELAKKLKAQAGK